MAATLIGLRLFSFIDRGTLHFHEVVKQFNGCFTASGIPGAIQTEVWVAEAPTHLIHFNGERFLGPYDK